MAGSIVTAVRRRFGRRGVNVVGYLDAATGLGERARELVATLRAAGIDVSEWPVPAGDDAPVPEQPVHDTTIAVVTAVQLAGVRERLPVPFERCGRTIGYFFWELAAVPDEQQWGVGLVDEIWAPTRFVEAAYRSFTDTPVRHMPLPLPRPSRPSSASSVVLPAAGSFEVVVSFDFFSVMERKNPIGAIEAFRLAFPSHDDRVRLTVKTVHGAERPGQFDRLVAAAGDDPRIVVVDDELAHVDLLALIARADVLLSLHRSEGLGLHIAEAMALGTQVIASRYGGPLDIVDDTTAALVDVSLVEVADGEGAYAAPAQWADPDLDQAAEWLRRAYSDPEWRLEMVARAAARSASSPTRTEIGASLASALR